MAYCNIGKASTSGTGVTVIVRSGKEVRAIPATICSTGLGSDCWEQEKRKRTEMARKMGFMGF
jgi:hypothetical protein